MHACARTFAASSPHPRPVFKPSITLCAFPTPGVTVTFAIVGGNDNGGAPAFRINATTGVVYTASLHDYEGTPRQYLVNISLTDDSTALYGTKANITTYHIVRFVLQDANDAPQLNTTPYFHMRENLPRGTSVYNVTTFDQDVNDTGAWVLAGCWLGAGWVLAGCWLGAGWVLAGCWLGAGGVYGCAQMPAPSLQAQCRVLVPTRGLVAPSRAAQGCLETGGYVCCGVRVFAMPGWRHFQAFVAESRNPTTMRACVPCAGPPVIVLVCMQCVCSSSTVAFFLESTPWWWMPSATMSRWTA
jgi:hypothetical protein